MSEIATLEQLERHLSHAPQYSINHAAKTTPTTTYHSKGSALEAYFSEIRYSSFAKEKAKLYTQNKPRKNGNAARLTYRLRLH